MTDDSDPSFSEELAGLPQWDSLFWLSRAFIEGSQCLCRQMLEGGFTSQYSSSRVVLHLARHGIELYLKAAISAATGNAPIAGHNIDKLLDEYHHVYPDQRMRFDIPSAFSASPNPDLFPDTIRSFHATLDQRHRYPADRQGRSFAEPEVFDPGITLAEIEELKKALSVLEFCAIRPTLERAAP